MWIVDLTVKICFCLVLHLKIVGEEKPKRTNKKKQDKTSEVPASKAKKILGAKKETAEKISKPRNTRVCIYVYFYKKKY